MLKRYLVNHFQGIDVIEFRTEADLRREHVNNMQVSLYIFLRIHPLFAFIGSLKVNEYCNYALKSRE